MACEEPGAQSLARPPLGKVSRERTPGRLQVCANPLSQSHLPPFPKGSVLCSRKIYPFPTQMSFPDQLPERQAAPNPRPVLRAPSPSASPRCSPGPSPAGTLAHDPARGQGCPTSRPGNPGLGCVSRPRGSAPGSAGGDSRLQEGSHCWGWGWTASP